jgi:hypothetical protein
MLGPTLPVALAAEAAPLMAQVRIELRPTAYRGHARVASARTVYTRAWSLRAGRQVLSLPLTHAALRHALLRVTVVIRATTQVRAAAAQTSLQMR